MIPRAEARDNAVQLNFGGTNSGAVTVQLVQPSDSSRTRSVPDSAFKGSVPKLPMRHVPRSDLIDSAGESLTSHRAVALVGMGGAGKTTLAKAIAHDPQTRTHFSDRVLWVDATPGKAPIEIQERIVRQMERIAAPFTDDQEGRQYLERMFSDKPLLLVLDNVWDTDVLNALDVVPPHGALLFTTRDRGIADAYGAEVHEVDKLHDHEAAALLSHWTRTPTDELPAEADSLCELVDNHALGVAIVGAMVGPRDRGQPRWRTVLSRLNDAAYITEIESSHGLGGYPHLNVFASIALSIDQLTPAERDRYRELAVFEGRGSIPLEAVAALWASAGMTTAEADVLMELFVGRSLAQRDFDGRYSLHDLEFDVVRRQLAREPGGAVGAHRCLIKGYHTRTATTGSPTRPASGTPVSWSDGPDDGYLLQNLAYHLAQADLHGQLDNLLMSFAWMERKLAVIGINDLLADYTHYSTDRQRWPAFVEAVHDTLHLSAHALLSDPHLLAGQLVGRLLGNPEPEIRRLVDTVCPSNGRPWLRPRTSGSLTGPGGPLERTLLGGDEPVKAVAISADGHLVASCGGRTVHVWERSTGKSEKALTPHTGDITTVAIMADGLRIVTGGLDDTVRVLVWRSGREMRTLPIYAGSVYSVAVTEDCERIIVGSSDKTVQVWALLGEQLEPGLQGHSSQVQAVALSADGRFVVSGGYDGTVCVWDRATRQLLHQMQGPAADVEAVAVSADGRYVVCGCQDGTVRAWDLEQTDTEQVFRDHSGSVHAVAISADGQRIFSAGQDQTVLVWNRVAGTVERPLSGHQGAVYALALSADDRCLVSSGHDGTVRIWNLTRENVAADRRNDPTKAITAVALSADGRRLICVHSNQPVTVLDLHRGGVEHPLQDRVGLVEAAAVTPDGGRLVCVGPDEPVSVWDLSTGRRLYALGDGLGEIYALAITADGHRIAIGGRDKTVQVWELPDNGIPLHVRTLTTPTRGALYAVTFTPDGQRVISAGYDGIVRVWDLNSGTLEYALSGHEKRIGSIAVTSDCRFIVSGSHDGTVRVWRLGDTDPMHILRGHNDRVHAVAVTADGQKVISGGRDGTLRLWDLEHGVELAQWITDSTNIVACAGHPTDPTTLAYGDESGRAAVLTLHAPCTQS